MPVSGEVRRGRGGVAGRGELAIWGTRTDFCYPPASVILVWETGVPPCDGAANCRQPAGIAATDIGGGCECLSSPNMQLHAAPHACMQQQEPPGVQYRYG